MLDNRGQQIYSSLKLFDSNKGKSIKEIPSSESIMLSDELFNLVPEARDRLEINARPENEYSK